MGAHAYHEMHPNSLEIDLTEFETRHDAVFEAYRRAGVPLTDRQVAQALGFADMNAVRPSITIMVNSEDPRLKQVDNVIDEVTGRKVRRCAPFGTHHDSVDA